MRFAAFLFAFAVFVNTLTAQWRPSPEDLFEEAEEYFLFEEYIEALSLYSGIAQPDSLPGFIRYRIGVCYLNIPGQEYRSLPHLEFASQNVDPGLKNGSLSEKNAPADVYLFLGIAQRHLSETDAAIEAFERFLEISKDPVMQARALKELEKTRIAKLFKLNEENIRTSVVFPDIGLTSDEMNLVISGDEKTLAWAAAQKFYDALFYTRLENEVWTKPRNITPQVGSDGDAYPLSLSYDGNTMLLYRYDAGTNGDIYVSSFDNDRWSKLERLPEPVNSDYYEAYASLSESGKEIFFSSNRPGGYGGLDIYQSVMDESGNWGPAINLGPQINTMEDELTPFVSKDGKYLFFSSGGHTNMGGLDVFYAWKLDDGTWSQARNPGYPLNSTGDDKFFIPVGNGSDAYYAMQTNEQYPGREFMKVSDFLRKHDVQVNVKVQVKENHPGLSKSRPVLTLSDTRIQKPLEVVENFPENGRMEFSLAPGYYEVSISNDKYISDHKDFAIAQYYPEPEMELLLELHPEPVQVELRNVYFSFDNAMLSDVEKEKLTVLAAFLKEYPAFEIDLTGYTDISGNRNYNIMLSGRRAESVLQFLVSQGIDQSRMSYSGRGPENYIATNAVIEGRKLNRRVEIQLKDVPEFVQMNYVNDIPEQLRFKKD
jgi:outer membrane protein OmpA-like peptidoglycan-associated protein